MVVGLVGVAVGVAVVVVVVVTIDELFLFSLLVQVART
jgi:hypothetical protein